MRLIDANTKDEILKQARKVFAEVGYKEATIRQICRESKTNVCLISYYFGGKEGLYKAVFQKIGEDQGRIWRRCLCRDRKNRGSSSDRGSTALRRWGEFPFPPWSIFFVSADYLSVLKHLQPEKTPNALSTNFVCSYSGLWVIKRISIQRIRT